MKFYEVKECQYTVNPSVMNVWVMKVHPHGNCTKDDYKIYRMDYTFA
jgi:hypothetical protein